MPQTVFANVLREFGSEGNDRRRRLPEIGVFAGRARDDADLARFVQSFEDGVNGREIVGVDRQIHADAE
jgi:hypothetical protein